MHSFLLSAKSGDQVKQAFFRIASLLGGVTIMKSQYDAQAIIVPAIIVDHQRLVNFRLISRCFLLYVDMISEFMEAKSRSTPSPSPNVLYPKIYI